MDRQSIECQICSNNCDADKPAQYPKFLPCGYTLCAGCIDKLIANSRETTLQCPVCIEATPKKPSNAAQLKNNYTLMSLLGSHESGVVKPTTSKTALCPTCRQMNVLDICIECKTPLCKKCLFYCSAAHLNNLWQEKTGILNTFEKHNSLYLNKQYFDKIDRIIGLNNQETKAIMDHIDVIEQRLRSEKAVLLEKLDELKENNAAFECFRTNAQLYINASEKWRKDSSYKKRTSCDFDLLNKISSQKQLESDYKHIEKKKVEVGKSILKISNNELKTMRFVPNTFQKDAKLIGDLGIKKMSDDCNMLSKSQLKTNNKLASGSADAAIIIWDIDSCLYVRTLDGHTSSVYALQFLGDNKLASGSSDNKIKIWNVESGSCLRTLEGHTSWVHALQFLGDNKLASGSSDNTIKIWNVESGSCLRTLEGHTSWVYALQFVGINKLASGSGDETIRIWNIESGECLRTLEGHTNLVWALQSLGNNILASGSKDKTIRIWNIESGSCMRTLEGHTNLVYALQLLGNNKLASGSEDCTIRLWDIESGACLRTLEGHTNWVWALQLVGNNILASGSKDKTIKIWNIESAECMRTLWGNNQYVYALQLLEVN